MADKHVIVGDGVAGATAAETIRKKDEDAEIHVFTDEKEPLYNRIMLKTFMKGSLPLQYTRVHDEDWYEKRNIELHLETPAEDVDTDSKELKADGKTFSYDSLLVATGGAPRELPQDEGYENVHYMWTMEDAENIKNAAEDAEKAVVIGGGLLGIDLAVAFAENEAETYYLIRESNWWSRGLDEKGAGLIHSRLDEKGVNVMTETEAEELEAENGEVEKVVTADGEELDCDSVAVAIGQVPNSDILDVEKNDYDMIQTDRFLETSAEDVYAAGNLIEYDSPIFERKTVNGSWDHSEAMGECAAENMLGKETEFDYVNTYGVGHFDVQFLAIGDWTGEPVQKKYSESEYRRLYFDGQRLVGAVMIGFTKGQEEIKQMIREKEEVEDREKLLEKEYWN